jgi:DNA-directed RNA polymerase subunit K/omega
MTKKKVEDSDNDEYDIEDIPENLDDELDDDDVQDDDDDELVIDVDNDNDKTNLDEEEVDYNYVDYNGFETEIPIENNSEYISIENRISCNRLTKYEMVRILGERTKQLTMGAKPLIKNFESLSYDKISEEELKLNMIPFKIKRPLPNGKFEIWTLDELKKDHLYYLLD